MIIMSDTEKITVNVGVVDLGKIDLLIEQGHYSNRTDFIRTALRNQLNVHSEEVKAIVTSRVIVVGVVEYDERRFLDVVDSGHQLDIRVVGQVSIANDVTPDLALRAIKSIRVFGVLRAPEDVKSALFNRLNT